jgi:hypothetical protein
MTTDEGNTMEALLVLAILIVGLVIFDILAVTLGVDSRDAMADDWTRSRPI